MKKERVVTEFQIIVERIQYIAGKRNIMKSLEVREDMDAIFKALGTEKREMSDGTMKYVYVPDSVNALTKTYANQYRQLAEKLQQFYETVDTLPDEKLKYICELRYVEGWTFKDISKKLDVSLPMVYAYNDIIVNTFKENGCGWAVQLSGNT